MHAQTVTAIIEISKCKSTLKKWDMDITNWKIITEQELKEMNVGRKITGTIHRSCMNAQNQTVTTALIR